MLDYTGEYWKFKNYFVIKKNNWRDLPGSPVVMAPRSGSADSVPGRVTKIHNLGSVARNKN